MVTNSTTLSVSVLIVVVITLYALGDLSNWDLLPNVWENKSETEIDERMSVDGGAMLEMPNNNDPFFDSENLMPKGRADDPEWAEAYRKGDNMVLQGNFIDANAATEKFQITRSVCGRRYQSRELRRVPTVTRDPTTVNSWGLPVIDPACAKEYNNMWGNLDFDCDTQTWVKDENTLSALGYPLPQNKLY